MKLHRASADALGLGFINGFGSASYLPQGRECPADGSWETWCACMYSGDGNLHSACNQKFDLFGGRTSPGLLSAPWTDAGASARGLPKVGGTGLVGSIFQQGGAADQAQTSLINAGSSAINPGATPVPPPNAQPAIVPSRGTGPFIPGVVDVFVPSWNTPALPSVMPDSTAGKVSMGVVAALAVGGAALLLLSKKRKSGAGLQGYHRRRRRSRR